jgi:hypothetical protein
MVEADCMEVIEVANEEGNSIGPAAAIYKDCV